MACLPSPVAFATSRWLVLFVLTSLSICADSGHLNTSLNEDILEKHCQTLENLKMNNLQLEDLASIEANELMKDIDNMEQSLFKNGITNGRMTTSKHTEICSAENLSKGYHGFCETCQPDNSKGNSTKSILHRLIWATLPQISQADPDRILALLSSLLIIAGLVAKSSKYERELQSESQERNMSTPAKSDVPDTKETPLSAALTVQRENIHAATSTTCAEQKKLTFSPTNPYESNLNYTRGLVGKIIGNRLPKDADGNRIAFPDVMQIHIGDQTGSGLNFTAQCYKEKFKTKNGEMKDGIKVKCKPIANTIPCQEFDVRKLNEQLLTKNFQLVENANSLSLTLRNAGKFVSAGPNDESKEEIDNGSNAHCQQQIKENDKLQPKKCVCTRRTDNAESASDSREFKAATWPAQESQQSHFCLDRMEAESHNYEDSKRMLTTSETDFCNKAVEKLESELADIGLEFNTLQISSEQQFTVAWKEKITLAVPSEIHEIRDAKTGLTSAELDWRTSEVEQLEFELSDISNKFNALDAAIKRKQHEHKVTAALKEKITKIIAVQAEIHQIRMELIKCEAIERDPFIDLGVTRLRKPIDEITRMQYLTELHQVIESIAYNQVNYSEWLNHKAEQERLRLQAQVHFNLKEGWRRQIEMAIPGTFNYNLWAELQQSSLNEAERLQNEWKDRETEWETKLSILQKQVLVQRSDLKEAKTILENWKNYRKKRGSTRT